MASSDTQIVVIQGGQVRALDAAAFASEILAKVSPATQITAPGPATVTAGTPSTTAVPLTWVPPTTGTTPFSYQVEYRLSGTAAWSAWSGSTTSTSATVSGLTAGTSYDFHVITSNGGPTSSTSATVTATTAALVPSAPTGLAAANETSTTVALTWTAPATGTPSFSYQPYFRQHGATNWIAFGALISATAVTVTGLTANTSYDFQVTAQNGGGIGPASTSVTASTTASATVAPGAATGLAASGATASTLTLAWTAPATGTAPFSYQVFYRKTGGTTWIAFQSQITATTEVLTGLAAATSYDMQVQTINSAGTSTSSSVTASTAAATTQAADGVSGTQNTGTTAPVIAGPTQGVITTGAVLTVSGITLSDAFAAGNSGTCALNISCTVGTLSTTAGGNAVSGSGTNSIANYKNTFANCQSAVANLTYTAPPAPGSDTISVNLFDQSGAQNTLTIQITVHAPSSSTGGGGGGTAVIPSDGKGPQAARIADMLERFGVNTFSQQTVSWNPWGSAPSEYTASTTIAALNQITSGTGLTMQIREYHFAGREANSSGSGQSTWCPAVASGTGARITMAIGSAGTDDDVPSMLSLAQASAAGSSPWLAGLEGVNEPNGASIVSQTNVETAQKDLWTNGSPIAGVTILGPSIVFALPKPETSIDAWAKPADVSAINATAATVSVHYYPSQNPAMTAGSARGAEINDVHVGEILAWGNVPAPQAITEWHPTYYLTNTSLRFNDSYNGYYAPIYILEAFRAGFVAYDWFSLFDFSTTASGLFAQNTSVTPTVLTPRNAGLVVQAMYKLAGIAGSTKHSFVPGQLDYTVTGPSGVIPPATSPNGAMLHVGFGGIIIDSTGAVWSLSNSGQIATNGTIDGSISGVTLLAYIDSKVWIQSGGNWQSKSATAAPPYITPGSGSFQDSAGNTYTLDAQGNAVENGTAMPDGSGTAAMEYYNGTIYAQDATSKSWYTWDATAQTFTGPVTAPPTPTFWTTASASPIPTAAFTGSDYSGIQHLLFQNDSGEYLLYLWNSAAAPEGTAQNVTIAFNTATMATIKEYVITNTASSSTPTTSVQNVSNVKSITCSVNASVHVLAITYGSGVPADTTVDFTNATGRTVQKQLFGFSTGGLAGTGDFALALNTTFQQTAAKLKPTLIRINATSQIDAQYAAGTLTNPLNGLINGLSTFADPGCIIILGVGPTGNDTSKTPATWANDVKSLAQYFVSIGHPITHWEVGNECDAMGAATYSSYFIAIADALHTVDASYQVGGTTASWYDGTDLPTWANTIGANRAAFISFHSYLSVPTGSALPAFVSKAQGFTDMSSARKALAGTPCAGLPLCLLEYNNWPDPQPNGIWGEIEQGQMTGAIYIAVLLLTGFVDDSNFAWGGLWDLVDDGYFGAIANAAIGGGNGDYTTIDPQGWFLGYGGQNMAGAQYPVVTSVPNLMTLATLNGSKFAILIVNTDGNNAQTPTIGFTGKTLVGQVTRFELSNANLTPLITTIPNMVHVSVPAASIVYLTGTVQ